jgi:hypothetical protein
MATVTLTQLQTDALLYCDQRPGGSTSHINTTELTRLINQAAKEFYDLLVASRGQEYFITSTPVSVVANTSSYALPAAFYELSSLTLEWSTTDHEIVRPLAAIADRADYTPPTVWNRYATKGYRMRGSQSAAMQLEFVPTPTSAVTARVQYIPVMTELVAGGDTINVANGWDKLITLKAALEILSIKGSTKQRATIRELFDEQLERVKEMAPDQDANEPGRIRDVQRGGDYMGDRVRGWY